VDRRRAAAVPRLLSFSPRVRVVLRRDGVVTESLPVRQRRSTCGSRLGGHLPGASSQPCRPTGACTRLVSVSGARGFFISASHIPTGTARSAPCASGGSPPWGAEPIGACGARQSRRGSLPGSRTPEEQRQRGEDDEQQRPGDSELQDDPVDETGESAGGYCRQLTRMPSRGVQSWTRSAVKGAKRGESGLGRVGDTSRASLRDPKRPGTGV
jgi:hypothetical protein